MSRLPFLLLPTHLGIWGKVSLEAATTPGKDSSVGIGSNNDVLE